MTDKDQHQHAPSWEEQLREQLSHHEAPPPADLWESIACDLAAHDAAAQQEPAVAQMADATAQPQRKALPLYARLAGAAAAVALTAGVGWWSYQSRFAAPDETIATAENAPATREQTIAKAENASATREQTIAKAEKTTATTEKTIVAEEKITVALNQNIVAPVTAAPTAVVSEATPAAPLPEPDTTDPTPDNLLAAASATDSASVATPADDRYYAVAAPAPYYVVRHDEASLRHFGLAFHVGQNNNIYDLAADYDDGIAHPGDYGIADGTDDDTPTVPLPEKPPAVQHPSYTYYYDHSLPVKTAALFRWRFSQRLALDAGLSYTFLRSKVSHTGPNATDRWFGRQRVHYLGVPVALSCQLFQRRRWSCYISAGGEVSKAVSVEWRNDSGKLESAPDHPWQTSLSASLGFQYALTRYVGIYLQPSADYYIDNGSPVETFYNEHPFTPSLQVGLRFNVK